jgi:hypothetical protein
MYAPNVAESSGNGAAHEWPEWRGPPEMIGGHVAGPIVIGRSEDVIVAARQVLAYPSGVQVDVEAHARGSPAHGEPAAGLPDLPTLSGLRFWLRFSDGREAALDDEAGLRTGHGPILFVSGSQTSYGGVDSREDADLTLWVWPLPPSGPMTLTCAWVQRGLRDATLVLDGDAILAAAAQAQPFWQSRS